MTFWDMATKWPLWFQIIFAAMILLIVVFIIIKGIEIKRGNMIFKINRKKKPKDITCSSDNEEKTSPHAQCPHSRDILLLLNEIDQLRYEKWNILFIEQLRDQMNYSEQKIEQIKVFLQKKYLDILSRKSLSQLVSSESYAAYQLVIKQGINDILNIIRMAFKENHLDDIQDGDFFEYLDNKSDYIISKGTDILNDTYFFNRDITREELYTENKELIGKIKEIVVDIFEKGRKVAVENRARVKDLDRKMEEVFKKYI